MLGFTVTVRADPKDAWAAVLVGFHLKAEIETLVLVELVGELLTKGYGSHPVLGTADVECAEELSEVVGHDGLPR